MFRGVFSQSNVPRFSVACATYGAGSAYALCTDHALLGLIPYTPFGGSALLGLEGVVAEVDGGGRWCGCLFDLRGTIRRGEECGGDGAVEVGGVD